MIIGPSFSVCFPLSVLATQELRNNRAVLKPQQSVAGSLKASIHLDGKFVLRSSNLQDCGNAESCNFLSIGNCCCSKFLLPLKIKLAVI